MRRTTSRGDASRAMRCLSAAALFVASTLAATPSWGCGYCIEDRIAAVYDHAVITRASATGHKVAFYAVLGAALPGDAAAQAIRRDVESVRGVDGSSVRYSSDLAALSLSFDPRSASWADIDRKIGKALAPRGLTLGLINIVDRPSQIRASAGDARQP